MTASHCEMEIERGEQKDPEEEPNLDRMAQQVQILFKFNNFYNQMDFDVGQRLVNVSPWFPWSLLFFLM